MPFLSPVKLLVILVVALVVLGPDKLPRVARQIGALWAEFQRFRRRFESEVGAAFPDLPSAETIGRAVRSPLTLLDHLDHLVDDPAGNTAGDADAAPTARAEPSSGTVVIAPEEAVLIDDPSLN
jgi:sec-independent protein translocase protein TatB